MQYTLYLRCKAKPSAPCTHVCDCVIHPAHNGAKPEKARGAWPILIKIIVIIILAIIMQPFCLSVCLPALSIRFTGLHWHSHCQSTKIDQSKFKKEIVKTYNAFSLTVFLSFIIIILSLLKSAY